MSTCSVILVSYLALPQAFIDLGIATAEMVEAKVQKLQGELKASDDGPGVLGALVK
jgi:hypothetical protein